MISRRHSESAPSLEGATPLEQAALAWFARCNQGLSADQEAEFEAWLAADPRHAQLFNELDGTWALLAQAAPPAAADSSTAVARSGARSWLRFGLPLVAAAALALVYMSWWRPAHYSVTTTTEVGGLRALRLPDGSLVTLNTDSVAAAEYSPEERRVRLERGEAHFTVAKNPDRPFIVNVAGVSIRAVGTAFNIRLESKTVEILVTEGRVRVDESASGHSLLPAESAVGRLLVSGEKITVALPDPARPVMSVPEVRVASVPSDEIERQLAWQERRLDFLAAPLVDIVREFNRYNEHKLVIGDPALAARRFGGSFKPDDQAGFLRMLDENFGISAEALADRTVLREKR